MKTKTIPSPWLVRDGRRLDCGPYMSGALESRVVLERLSVRKDALRTLTTGHAGGIFNGPQFARRWVESPEYGVPFVGSSSMLQSDLSNLPLLRKKDALSNKLSFLRLEKGMTLISCSGTIGRMVYVRPDMAGIWSSQDVMKVVPDEAKIPPGYLYAYLSSKFGVPLVVGGTYGAIIQHIEPHHIANLPVPRLGEEVEGKVHMLVEDAAMKRSEYQRILLAASSQFFMDSGVEELTPSRWHELGPDLGFCSTISPALTLRASHYSPRAHKFIGYLAAQKYHTLGEICADGYLNTGARFRRIDCEPQFGARLIGQKQGFWMRPEGRWISVRHAPKDIYAKDESVLIASSGTLGEHELYCRPIFVTGRWLKYVYSEHFLRVISGDKNISGAYLFAFFRSELAFRILRCLSTGSKQQEIHLELVSKLPIPLLPEEVRDSIEMKVRKAFQLRGEADSAEEEATSIIEQAIEEAH